MLGTAANTELLKFAKGSEMVLQLRNTLDATSWATVEYVEASIEFEEDIPTVLRATLVNADLSMSAERDPANRTIVRGLVRATFTVGGDTEVRFDGIIYTIEPVDENFSLTGYDWLQVTNETLCDVSVEPDSVDIALVPTVREITQIDPVLGEIYGFEPDGSGTDDAFDQATQLKRRSWVEDDVRVWKDSGMDEELPGTHWAVDYISGAILIYERDPAASYWVSGVRAYKESLATGASNCDFARLIEASLLYPKTRQGPGFTLGTAWAHTITAVNTGAKRFTIAGDFTWLFKDNGQIYIQQGTNPGTYTINGNSTLSGGNTLIVVDQTVGSGTAGGYLSLDTGLDVGAAISFEGNVGDLLRDIRERQQQNIKLYYHPGYQRFILQVVVQKSTPDRTAIYEVSIDQSRSDNDLWTGIEVRGQTTFPLNQILDAGQDTPIRLTDITTGGDWFGWINGGGTGDSTFADQIPKVYDGDANSGCGVHNLPSEADIDANPGSKYEGWYRLFVVDLGFVQNVDRVRAFLPGTMNPKAQNGHQGIFWPGLRLEVSETDATGVSDDEWHLLTNQINGRYKPDSEIDVSASDMIHPRGRYLRVLAGAFKNGYRKKTQRDPMAGLAELEVYTNSTYKIRKFISTLFPVVTANTGSDYFEIDGDFTAGYEPFKAGDSFAVLLSTGNDATYTATAVVYIGGKTRISVAAVPSSTADGYLYSKEPYTYTDGSTQQRDYPTLYRRFGQHKIQRLDLGAQFPESLASDYAIQRMAEYIRLFQRVSYTAACDPRTRLYETIGVVDDFNGDVDSVLVNRVSLKHDGQCRFEGTNYREEPLDD